MRVVIPSLGYADFLATTLPAWRRMFPDAELVVVTADGDPSSVVAAAHGAVPVLTGAWTRDGAVFNKAAALDVGLGVPAVGSVCVAADADVVPCGCWPDEASLERNVLYGCARYHCPTPEVLEAFVAGDRPRSSLGLILPRRAGDEPFVVAGAELALERGVAKRALGYFQAFRYRAGLTFGSSQSAGGYDHRFGRAFSRRAYLPGQFYVVHLGALDRRNWHGRVVPAWGEA